MCPVAAVAAAAAARLHAAPDVLRQDAPLSGRLFFAAWRLLAMLLPLWEQGVVASRPSQCLAMTVQSECSASLTAPCAPSAAAAYPLRTCV